MFCCAVVSSSSFCALDKRQIDWLRSQAKLKDYTFGVGAPCCNEHRPVDLPAYSGHHHRDISMDHDAFFSFEEPTLSEAEGERMQVDEEIPEVESALDSDASGMFLHQLLIQHVVQDFSICIARKILSGN